MSESITEQHRSPFPEAFADLADLADLPDLAFFLGSTAKMTQICFMI